MNKKIKLALLAIVTVLAFTLVFTACNDETECSPHDFQWVITKPVSDPSFEGLAVKGLQTETCTKCNEKRNTRPIQFSVDLSTLSKVKNTEPLATAFADFIIEFSAFPVDVTQFSATTVRAKYYDVDNVEIPPDNGYAMVVLLYDVNGDLRGPKHGIGPNIPLKEFNIGGSNGSISTDTGTAFKLTSAPGGILFQNTHSDVKYIEVTEIIFHHGPGAPWILGEPEGWPIENRWFFWSADDSTATINGSVADNGVVTITVSGFAESHEEGAWHRWKTGAIYDYTARANTSFTYVFEAWTELSSGNRTVEVKCNNDNFGKEFEITEIRQTFSFTGPRFDNNFVDELMFHCADKLGVFYVRILAITAN